MSSNKGKDKIQKKVEASILDAVTKFKSDESSLSPYEHSKSIPAESILLGDKSAQILWDQAKEHSSPHINIQELIAAQSSPSSPSPSSSSKDSESASEPAKEETKNKTRASSSKTKVMDAKGESTDLKTIALDLQTHRSSPSYPQPPTADFIADASADINNLNLVQFKLYEGEHLKIAQHKIEELEASLDKLRLENERLATACELFQKRADEAVTQKQDTEKKLNYNEERLTEERSSFKSYMEQRDALVKELKDKIEHLESRLSTDIRKSRGKERELENRLELARLEKISLVGSKDDIILDLKRQVDQLNHELGNYRRKTAQMNQTLEANQEQFRRTVRALRLALTNLEVNDPIGGQVKKAE